MSQTTQLLVGTRKGAWVYRDDGSRGDWSVEGPLFLGQIVNHYVQDPRNPGIQLIAAKTGHLGPTVFRSLDAGATWTEASRPPAFRQVGRSPERAGGRPHASGWSQATPASPASGGPAPRRPGCSSATTTAPPGTASPASTTIRCTMRGSLPDAGTPDGALAQPDRHRSARLRLTCTSPPPPAACSRASTERRAGRR